MKNAELPLSRLIRGGGHCGVRGIFIFCRRSGATRRPQMFAVTIPPLSTKTTADIARNLRLLLKRVDRDCRLHMEEQDQNGEPKPEQEPKLKLKLLSELKVRVRSDPNVRVRSEPNARVRSEPKVRVRSEPNVRVKSETNTGVRSEPNGRVRSEQAGDGTGQEIREPNAGVRSEPNARVRLESRVVSIKKRAEPSPLRVDSNLIPELILKIEIANFEIGSGNRIESIQKTEGPLHI
ncbi:hypothetical protein EVAR_32804_1 [Eumeta japonica]|uniref:Uncharacterized protein n=1 Tax=Eumeta variegata TaxID=151549 RepID=A0A4C1WD03_EUMVA|nr:hypothetical protein EVAR_32804_1 [Eumeta japonica]